MRNRFKRVIREAFRLCRAELPAALQLHVRPNQLHEKTSMQEVQAEILRLFRVAKEV